MNITHFINEVHEQFDETDRSELQPDTVFKDLDEWSSLIALSIIAMVDDEYNVKIKGDDFRSVDTLQNLFDLVVSRKKDNIG